MLTQTLGGCTHLAVYCSSYFSPWDTNFLSSLDSKFQEELPNMDTCLLWILNISVGSRACPRQICLQIQKGNRKRKEKLWQPQRHQLLNIMRLAMSVKAWFFTVSKKSLLINDNSFGEDIGHRGRGPDSSVTSLTTCVTFDKTGNHSGPHFPHLSNGWFGQETFSLQVFLQNTSFQTHFYIKLHYIHTDSRGTAPVKAKLLLLFSSFPTSWGPLSHSIEFQCLMEYTLKNHRIGYFLRTLPD